LIGQTHSQPLWLFIALTPLATALLAWILVSKCYGRQSLAHIPISLLLLPYILLQFAVNWLALMDEFILKKPSPPQKMKGTAITRFFMNLQPTAPSTSRLNDSAKTVGLTLPLTNVRLDLSSFATTLDGANTLWSTLKKSKPAALKVL
jgi:hypothetical protein